MKYRLFLYKTSVPSRDNISLDTIHHSLCRGFSDEDEGNRSEDNMLSFDASRVTERIRTELGADQASVCKIEINQSPEKRVEYICIETGYDQADRIWPALVKVAFQEGLVLLDAQTNQYEYDPPDQHFARRNLTVRILDLNEQIRNHTVAFCQLRRLYKKKTNPFLEAAYVVTLNKSKEMDLPEQTIAFHQLLSGLLLKTEKLVCKDKCFIVDGSWYSVSYTLEAYRKNPNKICYIQNGEVCVDILHRISCVKALKWIYDQPGKNYHEIYSKTVERVFFTEMVRKYPNPADRFCASFNITKALKKEKMDVDYSSFQYYGAQVMFHRVPYRFCAMSENCRMETVSALKLEEEVATFVLPFVLEQYPYFYRRYYLTDNHIPSEMLRKITDRLIEMRTILYSGKNLEVLEPYLAERANFYALDQSKEYHPYSHDPSKLKELIKEHRLTIAHVYDIFIKWAEAQLRYGDKDELYNITGP